MVDFCAGSARKYCWGAAPPLATGLIGHCSFVALQHTSRTYGLFRSEEDRLLILSSISGILPKKSDEVVVPLAPACPGWICSPLGTGRYRYTASAHTHLSSQGNENQ